MNPRLPRITGNEVVAGLRKLGFDVVRIKGSHHFLRHPDGRATVVPEDKARADRRIARLHF